MNAGLITSYIIAGILLISMLAMNIRVSQSSAEITLTQITREKADAISDMIYDDIPNMGYDTEGKTSEIITVADEHKVTFYRKIDPADTGDPEEITWELTDEEIPSTKNPDDRVLVRIVDSDTTKITLGVTRFEIWYFDDFGLSTLPEDNEYLPRPVVSSQLTDIKQLYIALELESAEQIYTGPGGTGRYIRTAWEKRYSPGNIE
ncbi:MAG: hypothetical protein WEA56_17175 [Balneolaceae bacterium]